MQRAGLLVVLTLWTAGAPLVGAEPLRLLGENAQDFARLWESRGFPLIAATTYEAVDVEGQLVVTARSRNANRAMARRLDVENPTRIDLQWAWRVRSRLDGSTDERSRAGDDFAARVFVVFETSLVPTRTRAINYVWAAREPVGAVFRSPYTQQVAHVVLRNRDAAVAAETWRWESRDVLADYREIFEAEPTVVTAVAIMVDTDNTDGEAEADFRDIELEIIPPSGGSR
jgi:hypothetical protein